MPSGARAGGGEAPGHAAGTMEGGSKSSQACVGEWEGRGKKINIKSGGEEMFVDMGAGVPQLSVRLTSSGRAWPMTWAVMNKDSSGKEVSVYLFDMPSAESSTMMVRKPTGDGAVEFSRIGSPAPPAAEPPATRRNGERSRSPARGKPVGGKPEGSRNLSFAASLGTIVTKKKAEHTERERDVEIWLQREAKLLDLSVELFKQRCMRSARALKCSATVSFEVISRELHEEFPKRRLNGSTYYTGDWGPDLGPEGWFWSTRGVHVPLPPDTPVLYAELLQSMLSKFVDRLRLLGFISVTHEAGTWKVTAKWHPPSDKPGKKESDSD